MFWTWREKKTFINLLLLQYIVFVRFESRFCRIMMMFVTRGAGGPQKSSTYFLTTIFLRTFDSLTRIHGVYYMFTIRLFGWQQKDVDNNVCAKNNFVTYYIDTAQCTPCTIWCVRDDNIDRLCVVRLGCCGVFFWLTFRNACYSTEKKKRTVESANLQIV